MPDLEQEPVAEQPPENQNMLLRPWAEVADRFQQAFPALRPEEMRRAYEGQRDLLDWRDRLRGATEGVQSHVTRHVLDPAFGVLRTRNTYAYQDALDRMERGSPNPGDAETIASQERLRALDQQATSTFGGAALRTIEGLPAQAAAFATAGRLLGATPLGSIGAGAGAGMLARAGGRAVIGAASTPALTGTWLPQFAESGIEHPEQSAFRRLGTSLGHAAVQNTILSTFGTVGDNITVPGVAGYLLRQGVARPLAGIVQQQIADVASGAIGLQTHYGVMDDMLSGKQGKAWQDLGMQYIAFAAFAALHEARTGAPRRRPTGMAPAPEPPPQPEAPPEPGPQPGPQPPPGAGPEAGYRPGEPPPGGGRRQPPPGEAPRQSRRGPVTSMEAYRDGINRMGEAGYSPEEARQILKEVMVDLRENFPFGDTRDFGEIYAERVDAIIRRGRAGRPQAPPETPQPQADQPVRQEVQPQPAPVPPETPTAAPGERAPQATQGAVEQTPGVPASEPARPSMGGAEVPPALEAGQGASERPPWQPQFDPSRWAENNVRIGGRTVTLTEDPQNNAVRIDFEKLRGQVQGVSREGLQRGTRDLFRGLEQLVRQIGASGRDVVFETNQRRAESYNSLLEKAGFHQVGEPQPIEGRRNEMRWTWRMNAEAPPAPSPAPPRDPLAGMRRRQPVAPVVEGQQFASATESPESVNLRAIEQRVRAGETITPDEVLAASGLSARDQHLVREISQGRELNDIARDPGMLKENGEPYTKARLSQFHANAKEKVARFEDRIRDIVKRENSRIADLDDNIDVLSKKVAMGSLVPIRELRHDPKEVKARINDRYDAEFLRQEKLKRLGAQIARAARRGELDAERFNELREEAERVAGQTPDQLIAEARTAEEARRSAGQAPERVGGEAPPGAGERGVQAGRQEPGVPAAGAGGERVAQGNAANAPAGAVPAAGGRVLDQASEAFFQPRAEQGNLFAAGGNQATGGFIGAMPEKPSAPLYEPNRPGAMSAAEQARRAAMSPELRKAVERLDAMEVRRDQAQASLQEARQGQDKKRVKAAEKEVRNAEREYSRAANASAVAEAHDNWAIEARNMEVDPVDARQMAEGILKEEHGGEYAQRRAALINDVKAGLERFGVETRQFNLRNIEEYQTLRGFDDVTKEMQNRYPDLLPANDPNMPDVNATDRLAHILEGRASSVSLDKAYNQALTRIIETRLANETSQAQKSGISKQAIEEVVQDGFAFGETQEAGRSQASRPAEAIEGGELASEPPAGADIGGFDPSEFEPAGGGNTGGLDRSIADLAAEFMRDEGGHFDPQQFKEGLAVRVAAVKKGMRYFADGMRRLASISFPATTRANMESGEAVMQFAASRNYAREAADYFSERVMGERPWPWQKEQWKNYDRDSLIFGAYMTERRLRYMRLAFGRLSKEASDNAFDARARAVNATDPQIKANELREAARFADDATRYLRLRNGVTTIIGKEGSPFETLADYHRARMSPMVDRAERAWNNHVVPLLNETFRTAQGLGDFDPINTLTQIPGSPFNLIRGGETPTTAYTAGGGQGNLRNPKARRLRFSNQATGSSEDYELDIRNILEQSLTHSIPLAAQANMYRVMERNGLMQWGMEGRGATFGEEAGIEIPGVRPPPRTQAAVAGQTSAYFDPQVAPEVRQALKVDQVESWQKVSAAIMSGPTIGALASSVEAVSHFSNQIGAMFAPMVIRNIFRNVVGKVTGARAYKEKILGLGKAGALKPPGMESGTIVGPLRSLGKFLTGKELPQGARYFDPTFYGGQLLDATGEIMRGAAADAYDQMVQARLVERTETGKRDFLNRLIGQYEKSAQMGLVRLARNTGFGPFATAGTTMTTRAATMVTTGGSGLKPTSWAASARLRGETWAKIAAILGVSFAYNLLRWGRYDGDDSTPFGAIKLGTNEHGNTVYLDTPVSVIRRGLRAIGVLAIIEGMRRQQTGGQIADRAAMDVIHSAAHPFLGPSYQFGHTALTGRDAIGRDLVGRHPGTESHLGPNMVAAFGNANPIVSAMYGFDLPPSQREQRTAGDRALKLLGGLGPKTYNRPNAGAFHY